MNNQEKVQNEALHETLKHKKCGLGISMGVGKTRIALKHLIQNYDPFLQVLIVAPKKSIFASWIDELEKLECTELIKHNSLYQKYYQKNSNTHKKTHVAKRGTSIYGNTYFFLYISI